MFAIPWDYLQEEMIPRPNQEKWLEIADGFQKWASFQHCIAAIDGKHIRIIKPALCGCMFYKNKHFFSLTMLAIADSSYNFIYVDIGSYGKSLEH